MIVASEKGIETLGTDFEQLPTGEALRNYWRGKLPAGERIIFEYLEGINSATATREDISNATEYKTSSRNAYIQRLRQRKLVEVVNGEIRLSDHLW